jgi:hypothetical protein
MSGIEIESTEYVPVDRWQRLGRIDAIRRRVRRIAIGAGVVFLGLTLAPPGWDPSPLVTAIRLLSLGTAVSAWSVSAALDGATDDDGDGSLLAAVGVLVLVALAWSADRSRLGALLWRVLLGEVATSATDLDTGRTNVDVETETTESVAVTAEVRKAARSGGTYLGLLAALLVGGTVALAFLPRGGGLGEAGVFLLVTAVVGGLVGLLAALSLG